MITFDKATYKLAVDEEKKENERLSRASTSVQTSGFQPHMGEKG